MGIQEWDCHKANLLAILLVEKWGGIGLVLRVDVDATRTLALGTEIEPGGVVVVPRDQENLRSRRTDGVEAPVKQGYSITLGHGLVVDVTSHHDEIDRVNLDLLRQPREKRTLLRLERFIFKFTANMPITGVDDFHSSPDNVYNVLTRKL